jgi:iron complex outermembrane receptor protein
MDVKMNKILLLSLAAISVLASDVVMLPNIAVDASSIQTDSTDTVVIPSGANTTGDSASLLQNLSGVSTNYNGGVATLPAIHGMADTRVKTDVDGMTITSACPNHMNPALSYIDSSEVQSMTVIAGITPVSDGGDSIAGTIIVKSKDPQFASKVGDYLFYGDMTGFEHSNGSATGFGINANAATDKINIGYSGFAEKSGDYRDGHGNIVKDTLFNQQKQSLSLAYKIDENNVVSGKISKADVFYEGFPNQYMDMLGNGATNRQLSYKGRIGNLSVDATLYNQDTAHYMNKILTERTGNMPMNTESKESGYNVKATLALGDIHTVKFGSDGDFFKLNDWWPPDTVNHLGGMNPNTFWNINDGKRDRIGFYLEDDAQWTKRFSTNMGVRTDIVNMNTGDVVGYNSTSNDPVDAANFNALDHKKEFKNYDVTLMGKYEYSEMTDIEFGYARKTRSPDLYELYTWAGGYNNNPAVSLGTTSGPVAMDMAMINTFGDGAGYVGNINLKPEVANTFSATLDLHDSSNKEWGFKLTPYYTAIQNYIDVESLGKATSGGYSGIQLLRFINDDALMYGADVSGFVGVWDNAQYGAGTLKGTAGYTRGMRKDGGSLYHVMPFHAKVSLDEVKGALNAGIDVTAVASKDSVDTIRKEPETPSYTLIDLRAGYQINKSIRFDLAITNLMNLAYAMPLGGVDVVDYSKTSLTPLQGMGRSVDMAVNVKF